jgi:hypothetical protein
MQLVKLPQVGKKVSISVLNISKNDRILLFSYGRRDADNPGLDNPLDFAKHLVVNKLSAPVYFISYVDRDNDCPICHLTIGVNYELTKNRDIFDNKINAIFNKLCDSWEDPIHFSGHPYMSYTHIISFPDEIESWQIPPIDENRFISLVQTYQQ